MDHGRRMGAGELIIQPSPQTRNLVWLSVDGRSVRDVKRGQKTWVELMEVVG